ncbi:phosphotransferase [Epibacterium ulvae]|uniref:phosphotransferase n=1 Tax=Epibacterium ulvae TaxID=1156985 RepID=UPI001BFC7411|nr:phosphotransferase [Epibacterium ulvae]MBT8153458.1 phosphotransferase [Epibacterium ulvae]
MVDLPRAAEENLRLLCAELDGQLSNLQRFYECPDASVAQKVILRAGYSYNLWNRVQSASIQGLTRKKVSANRRLLLQNSAYAARNLDLIARMSRRSLEHAEKVHHPGLLRHEAYPKAIKSVRKSIKEILPAFEAQDSSKAIEIGHGKSKLDDIYDRLFRTYTRDMSKTKHTEDLANALLAAYEVHRMGDALQGISEAILSVNIGQSVHFDRYFALRDMLSDGEITGESLELEPIAETRSGSAISSVRGRSEYGDDFTAVFKDGELNKVREERAGVRSWHSIYPGLAPKILSYKKSGKSAALLIEYLKGETFENILLNESDAMLSEAQTALSRTLRDVWKRTRTSEAAQMASMEQLARRMKDIWRVHPEFASRASRIGALSLPKFGDLVEQAHAREKDLPAPFSVHIHGDFNLDNVIYDSEEKKVHFIDLHRSRSMDYVQDVSVFMVSNYRLQVQDPLIRRRVALVASEFHATVRKFARSQNDKTFEYRLALGLARSFATSTRFVLDNSHAQRMFERARYLLEVALACPQGGEHRLKLPIKELFID